MFDMTDTIKWWAKTIFSILTWSVLFLALFLAYGKQQDDVLKLKKGNDIFR